MKHTSILNLNFARNHLSLTSTWLFISSYHEFYINEPSFSLTLSRSFTPLCHISPHFILPQNSTSSVSNTHQTYHSQKHLPLLNSSTLYLTFHAPTGVCPHILDPRQAQGVLNPRVGREYDMLNPKSNLTGADCTTKCDGQNAP